jgi:hypothetical protein
MGGVAVNLQVGTGIGHHATDLKPKYFASIATTDSLAYDYIFVSLHVSANGGHPQVNTI